MNEIHCFSEQFFSIAFLSRIVTIIQELLHSEILDRSETRDAIKDDELLSSVAHFIRDCPEQLVPENKAERRRFSGGHGLT